MKKLLVERVDPYNIYRICIPMPLPIDNVNIYFSSEPVPTIVDAPPRGETYLAALEAGLGEIGFSLKEVERIIVSHPHIDHFGSAADIRENGHAEVWIHQGGAKALVNYEEEWDDTKDFYRKLLADGGVPASFIGLTIRFFDGLQRLGRAMDVDHYLKADDVIDLASLRFRVLWVPGHTPWCTIFCEEDKEIAFTGDFLLRDISANPVIQRPHTVPEGYISLKTYRASLAAVRAMGVRRALPGHGELIDRPHKRIGELLSFMERRSRVIRRLLLPEPQSPYQVILKLFPDLPPEQTLLALSEVMGYIAIFEEEGIVERRGDHPLLFSLVQPDPLRHPNFS